MQPEMCTWSTAPRSKGAGGKQLHVFGPKLSGLPEFRTFESYPRPPEGAWAEQAHVSGPSLGALGTSRKLGAPQIHLAGTQTTKLAQTARRGVGSPRSKNKGEVLVLGAGKDRHSLATLAPWLQRHSESGLLRRPLTKECADSAGLERVQAARALGAAAVAGGALARRGVAALIVRGLHSDLHGARALRRALG